jgi:hypothetical protein
MTMLIKLLHQLAKLFKYTMDVSKVNIFCDSQMQSSEVFKNFIIKIKFKFGYFVR